MVMKKKLIVFDMDGVLVDVSRSYRDVVRETVGIFFSKTRGSDLLPGNLFSLEDLAIVKSQGGLNNDWDLTYLVISLLLEYTDLDEHIYNIMERKNNMEIFDEIVSRISVSPLADYLKERELPLAEAYRRKGVKLHPVVELFSRGDVGSGNIIKQIFQEVYLGPGLFKRVYGFDSQFYVGEGFIDREKLILSVDTLQALSERHILAVATGRPKLEAIYALDRFGIKEYLSEILTLDDCLEAEEQVFIASGKRVDFSKPDPFMLNTIGKKFKERCDSFYFIGDMPDDMLAAKHSIFGYHGIGFVHLDEKGSRNKVLIRNMERLKESGAKKIFNFEEELKNFFV